MKRSILPLLVLSLACGDVPVDDPEGTGGTAPIPTGVIRGTVLYSGPRPVCDPATGAPLGNVVLTLFEYDNPPPPTGSASSAANLLTIPGVSLFSGSDDCLPADPTPADLAFITRTAEFTWPELGLGASYQIRGFYDYDGNFNPFFSVTNLPTAGDVAGGAFVDPNADPRVFRRLTFGALADRPEGEVLNGVSVALGAPVNTERPVFYMTSGTLSSSATLPTTADAVERENQILNATNTTLHLYDAVDDAARFDILSQAFAAAGMPVNTIEGMTLGDVVSPIPHAWYVRFVDANGDGEADPHPTLGAAGVIWLTPIILMQRARNQIELATGIPDVLLIPTVSNVAFLTSGQQVYDDDIAIGIPPLAAVNLNPADARCRIPYIPPGNTTSTYERITVECQEVPAGDYAVNAIQGLAGARPVGGPPGAERMCTPDLFGTEEAPPFLAEDGCFDFPESDPEPNRQIERCNSDNRCTVFPSTRSRTGFELEGGTLSGQAWGIPNALGDCEQLPDLHLVSGDCRDPERVLSEQGLALFEEQGAGGMFTVREDDATNVGTEAACSMAVDDDPTSPTFMMPREVQYQLWDEHGDDAAMLRDLCCEPVRHLCGVPLCGTTASVANPDVMVRAAPTVATPRANPENPEEVAFVPDCVPFEIPDVCCAGAVP